MEKKSISNEQIASFACYLEENERSSATISKYVHDVKLFVRFASGEAVDKTLVISYKEWLGERYTVSGANSMIAALNTFLKFVGYHDCCVKQFKVQRRVFSSEEEELTRKEYLRLVRTAESMGRMRLSLMLQTICCTGMRVSELSAVTVDSVKHGRAVVNCKGKLRTLFFCAGSLSKTA